MSAKKEVKTKENITLNELKTNEKNATKFNKDYNNFNERVIYTLNQQQNAINKILDNTIYNLKMASDEARREIPQYAQRITEYQEQTIQIIRDIASDFIEAEKQVVHSFQTQGARKNNVNFNNELWDLYNPEKIAENHILFVNNFTNYLLTTNNLINNAIAYNMRICNTALEQTHDNVKALSKTNIEI